MPSPVATFLAALSTAAILFSPAASMPRGSSIWPRACPVPVWTIKDLEVVFSNETFVPGNVTLTVRSSLSNHSESVRAEVPFNYFGRIDGTPENKDLRIRLQFNIDTATVTINQTWSCGTTPANASTPEWVIGYSEFPLKCPSQIGNEVFVCSAETLVVNGTIVTEGDDPGGYR